MTLDYSALLSDSARNRMPSAIRSLFPAELIPGMVSLLSGKPNSTTFPFQRITLELKPEISPNGDTVETVSIEGSDLDIALQYSATSGIPKLVDWIEQFQSKVHNRQKLTQGGKGEVWRCSFGNGSQDLLTKTFEALIDEGDSVVLESPAYSGILPSLVSHKAQMFEASTDDQGVEPSSLDNLLTNWTTNPTTSSHRFPKFLYTTPTGANPSGTSASDDRKRQILSIVGKHNMLLLEDDPYYFLSFSGLTADADPVTRQRGKSYFQLEADKENGGVGRVVRFDSFSKILSAGLRLGFVTGPNEILDAIDLDTSSRNLQTSGTSQAIAYALLNKWGIEGFLRHADGVARFYQDRLEAFESAATRILTAQKPPIASWTRPTAGMFLWINLVLPPTAESAQGDSFDLISNKAKAAGVLALPGVAFKPPSGNGAKKTSAYVRTSFSQVPLEHVDTAFIRLREVVQEAWTEAKLEIPQ
ncbi:related to aromatic amino acid aminotransferase I [Ustilago trichophora]|uniref:Related to aromatic amino acid aminotransferase I n=1 Tax=Ustilago trichophora TaxID=86804 RepID=A0A5C3EQW1_9BASI|nr:related to aromatic amino acid aminotransferase I [Ustilago trichophora]